MAETLGMRVGPDTITAVLLDAVAEGEPLVLQLGEAGTGAVCAVAQGDGGSVLVGAAATRTDGPVVEDPMERAVAGRVGALGAVINHVVGRAAMATGSAPKRIAIAVPDDYDVAARDRIAEAGAAAGVAETIAVPLSAALAAPVESDTVTIDPVAAVAAGAAHVASLAAAPIITREDLGETVSPKPQVVVPPLDPPTGPVSVFDPDPDGDPEIIAEPVIEPAPTTVRPAGAAISSAPVTPPTGTPAAGAGHGGPPSVPAQQLRYEPPRRRVPVAAIVAAVLVGLIAAVAGAILFFGDDPDSDSATTTDASTTTTEPPPVTDPVEETTTTVLDTTDGTDGETTTTTSSTTSTTTSTTTTTTEPTPSTTRPVAVGSPGEVTLVETGLQLSGSDIVVFDQSDEAVVAAVADLLGEPDQDDGYVINDFCEGERSRFVTWGDLELVFTEDEADSEAGRFTQWFASGHNNPDGLVTFGGVGVTATVGYLEVTFGDALVLVEAIPDDPTGLFASTNPGSGAVLNGTTTSLEPDGVVTSLWAGDSCTRIFT